MTLLLAVLGLVLPVLLGWLAARIRLLPDAEAAVDALNAYALYFAFPALILGGQLGSDTPLPRSPVFWGIVPLALALSVAPLPLLFRGGTAGTLGLVASFPNVAYLGLPVVEAVLGPDAVPAASLLVGVHVVLSLTVGPALLLGWSGRREPGALRAIAAKIGRQPLFWASVLGVLGRGVVPAAAGHLVADVLAPLGRSAGPTALFLLGVYLFAQGDRVRRLDGLAWAHVVVKLAWLPGITLGLALAAVATGALAPDDARVVVLQAAMPPGLTTFAIARGLRAGEDRVAQAIVAGTIASAVTLPLVAWGVGRAF